jgi:hypothetical protein
MLHTFWSHDFGAFVFGRKVLKSEANAQLELLVAQSGAKSKSETGEQDFWEKGLQEIVKSHTRFGRVGIFFDRRNSAAKTFCDTVAKTKLEYSPSEKKRSEKEVRITSFQTQVLCNLANEEMSDSVEFRRLARKFIRPAKHAHCDTIFFLDAIMGEEKTRKILKHIAGTQIQLFFPDDFMEELKSGERKTRSIKIESEDEEVFTKKIAEKILRTKLKK